MYEFLEKCIEKIDDSIEVLQGKPKLKNIENC